MEYVLAEHSWTTTVAPVTCTEAGYTLNECTCGNSYQSDVVDALGHNYTESIVDGQEVFVCTRCDHSYSQDHVHDYVEVERVEATCAQTGYVRFECACGDSYQSTLAPNINGHDYQETSRDAYWIYYTCTNCGVIAKEAITAPPVEEVSLSLEEDEMRDGCNEYLPIYTLVTHDYIYASGKLLRETITTTVDGEVTDTDVLDFYYNQNGRPYSFIYNGTKYYYILNLQGDVVEIYNASGTEVGYYIYNAWGEIISKSGTMAEINPIRYCGYYYDTELEMYYLQSRYYDPSICRFINADGYASTGQGFVGYDMFAYCNNNPASLVDHFGCSPHFNNTVFDQGGGYYFGERYKSKDAAACAFGTNSYQYTYRTGNECGAVIYEKTIGNTTYYRVGSLQTGSNKSIGPNYEFDGAILAAGWKVSGYVHSHPNWSGFSKADYNMQMHGFSDYPNHTSYVVIRIPYQGYFVKSLNGSHKLGTYEEFVAKIVPVGINGKRTEPAMIVVSAV